MSRGRSWLGGAVLLAASACAPQRHPETPVLPTASLHLPALMDVMEAGLDVPEPSANVVVKATGASLFGGSYDWHSCIFAHWALLAQARRDGDRERAARMLARLSEDALLEERARSTEENYRASEYLRKELQVKSEAVKALTAQSEGRVAELSAAR